MSDIIEHDPGSPEAIALGCTCSPILNNDGAGNIGPDGRPRFVCDQNCPLHGLAVLRQALEDGEARIIEPGDEDGEGADGDATPQGQPPPTIH